MRSRASRSSLLYAFWLLIVPLLGAALATEKPKYVSVTIDGERYGALDDRHPALYTADFGDCLGNSAINVTRFDAAYYKDNMTVLFHLEGETALIKEDIMMSIEVYAYGESRYELTFNPCDANIWSACPLQANTTVEAMGIIPVSPTDVAGIPDVALSIPDFEGQAILRMFSNSTQAQIGCFAAQLTNGNSLRQRVAAGIVLGVFTGIAVLTSTITTIIGDDAVEMRKHYAHSLSVMVVFAVWHHIYFSGALSMNWPNILVAFWSNYAWTGGIIYSESMQNMINEFIGSNKRNTSQVGAAGTCVDDSDLGGGYDIHAIYKRPTSFNMTKMRLKYSKRDFGPSATSGFRYTGQPIKPGLPLPGNYSGFAGTAAQEHIPASNAFMTGLLWFLILIAGVLVFMVTLKLLLETFCAVRILRKNRLGFFREHIVRYTVAAILRATFSGFFMILFLSMFQLSYLKSPGPVAVAIVVFLVVVVGMGTAAGFAYCSRIADGKCFIKRDRINVERIFKWRFMPWFQLSCQSSSPRSEDSCYVGSVPYWTISWSCGVKSAHEDAQYIKVYGWLASRYRRRRWWFFVVWLIYEFIRVSWLAGASSHPLLQALGLLVFEVFAFVSFACLRPFEGQRLNIAMIYLLGCSKIITTGISVALDSRFNISRIMVTVLGAIIIGVQGILTAVVLVMIVISVITSYMSVSRNQEKIRPNCWNSMREKYFARIDLEVQDVPRPAPVKRKKVRVPVDEPYQGPYFHVKQVKRMPKIEDEDYGSVQEMQFSSTSELLLPEQGCHCVDMSWQNHMESDNWQGSHTTLPSAARLHRPVWSLRKPYNSEGLDGTEGTRSQTQSYTVAAMGWIGEKTPEIPRKSSIRLVTETDKEVEE